jgi:hypothetical protein
MTVKVPEMLTKEAHAGHIGNDTAFKIVKKGQAVGSLHD